MFKFNKAIVIGLVGMGFLLLPDAGRAQLYPAMPVPTPDLFSQHLMRQALMDLGEAERQLRDYRSRNKKPVRKEGESARTLSDAASRKLSDKVKSGAAGRGATRGGASSRRGTTRFVSTAAPLAPARLAAELGRTPAERLQVERALAAMLATSKQMMERAGLAVDDVASGAQYAVLVGYRVRDEQEWEEVVGRADVRQALVRAAERARELSDAEDVEKQEEFERSVLVASVALGSYEEGRRRGDERMVEQAKRLAEATLARWTR